ncbi:2-octaprenyl-3-methyl-6-methoxy-1,4-benzoquinol hydroxylase (Precursor) [Striga asiatica]|uniref:2-octaprenyl-3-methyl-6-methoxy-1,4-benzoquinol hydroxylase (Precursor) n=1 Tax=Striga asiatica TaxID=4170 RepID=A0A5A7QCI5_STRAF|nr:2-octaprenyl-3-methyl-6-methoxy-1,4-benzoquinol hydroxylase (Precursor) [Striga asiatica]
MKQGVGGHASEPSANVSSVFEGVVRGLAFIDDSEVARWIVARGDVQHSVEADLLQIREWLGVGVKGWHKVQVVVKNKVVANKLNNLVTWQGSIRPRLRVLELDP